MPAASGAMTTVRPPSPGLVAGQVARHGLLTKIRDLGLELLAVMPHRQDRIDVNAVRYLAEWLGERPTGSRSRHG